MENGQTYLEIMPNPDNKPAAAVTGYKRLNTNLVAIQAGIDTTSPFDNGTVITVPAGGIVEVCGVLYRVTSQFSGTKQNANIAYWIVVIPSADGLRATFKLVERPGVWNHRRQGCYFRSGRFRNRRTLNWVSRGTLADIPTDATGRVYHENTKRTETISLQRGWHFVRLRSGAGGGNATGALGGEASIENTAEMIFFANKPFYNIKIGGSGQNGSASPGGGNNFARGGGGGGGSGEESVFDGFSTGMVPPGDGGTVINGGFSGGRGGRNGSNGLNGLSNTVTNGQGGLGGAFWGGGGGGGGTGWQTIGPPISGATGGDGGNGGDGGQSQPDGSPGGSCSVWALGNEVNEGST